MTTIASPQALARWLWLQIASIVTRQSSSVQQMSASCLQIHFDEQDDGAILAFLTGQDEIEAAASTLAAAIDSMLHPRGLALHVVPIYAAMPAAEQARAFEAAAPGSRKAVLATNIAETSVTIPGVRYVVDSGMVKARAYSAAQGIESLQVSPLCRAPVAGLCMPQSGNVTHNVGMCNQKPDLESEHDNCPADQQRQALL